VSASLLPVEHSVAPASVTLFDRDFISAIGATFATDIIRLAPGTSVASNGSAGTKAEVRIRGAESNHTLLFVDGIAFNDVASANVARFETLSTDGLDRIEILRGPASALFGSEALGGVVVVVQPDPLGSRRIDASLEAGSRDHRRAAATIVSGGETAGITASASWAKNDGIDIFGGGEGDKDGYESLHLSFKAVARPGNGDGEFGLVGHYLHHDIAYDGTPAPLFVRADTADVSEIETKAVRAWASYGLDPDAPFAATVAAAFVDNDNRNRDAGVRTNDSYGQRIRIGGQLIGRHGLGATSHEFVLAADHEVEDFGTRDRLYGGASDQDRSRSRTALVGEWLADWGLLQTDVAVRHDAFDRFRNATTLRGHVILPLGSGFALTGGYSEGIAQPNFSDLYGFSPLATFTPNPDLKPERSNGFEAGVRYGSETLSAEITGFSSNLRDEIVEDFSVVPYTIVNAPGTSRRRGVEVAARWSPRPDVRLTGSYTFLDARELGTGSTALRELRRPRHSASLTGEWSPGPWQVAATASWVGKRRDTDFDTYADVQLRDYLLANARIAYAVHENVELFARVENVFDASYQDLVGYAMPGRSAYAGVRVRLGD